MIIYFAICYCDRTNYIHSLIIRIAYYRNVWVSLLGVVVVLDDDCYFWNNFFISMIKFNSRHLFYHVYCYVINSKFSII